MRKVLIGGVAALLLLAAASPFILWHVPGPLTRETSVQIPEGVSVAGAARLLKKAGAIRNPVLFRRFSRYFGSGDPIKAGEFALPRHASAATILDMLQHGKPIQRLITVPEGMPSIMVHERLMAEPLLTGPVDVPAEGSILPDSYSFERGETRAAVVKRMQSAMARTLAKLWAARKPTAVVKSPQDAIILASIVEKETGKPAERRMVAGVYGNRLRIGMALQADPTVIYPITKGKPLGRRILKSELLADNGYNTYVRPGLPDGPIANPGRASIAAVLDPAPTKALYFVADGTGGHVFADTLAQHQANVFKWYEIRRKRGEM